MISRQLRLLRMFYGHFSCLLNILFWETTQAIERTRTLSVLKVAKRIRIKDSVDNIFTKPGEVALLYLLGSPSDSFLGWHFRGSPVRDLHANYAKDGFEYSLLAHGEIVSQGFLASEILQVATCIIIMAFRIFGLDQQAEKRATARPT